MHSNRIAPLVYDQEVNATNVDDATTAADKQQSEENADLLSALLIPCALSLLISLIHSQIVATNMAPGSSTKNKLRRFSITSFSEKPNAPREQRLRRRKKFVRQVLSSKGSR